MAANTLNEQSEQFEGCVRSNNCTLQKRSTVFCKVIRALVAYSYEHSNDPYSSMKGSKCPDSLSALFFPYGQLRVYQDDRMNFQLQQLDYCI